MGAVAQAIQDGEVPHALALMMGTAKPGSKSQGTLPHVWLGERGFERDGDKVDDLHELLEHPPAIAIHGRVYWRPNRIEAAVKPLYACDKDVTAIRAAFLDWDEFPLSHQWDLIQSMPLLPSAVVWTGNKSLHAYWLLDSPILATDDVVKVWKNIQRGFIQTWGGDHTIINPSRIMAHAGSPHRNGVQPMVWLPEQTPRYGLNDLAVAYGVTESAPKAPPLPKCGPKPRLIGSQSADLAMFSDVIAECLPHGGDGSGTFGDQRALVWSALDWAAEKELPKTLTHPVILDQLYKDRPRDTPRLLEAWELGKHGAGTFVLAGQRAGIIPWSQ